MIERGESMKLHRLISSILVVSLLPINISTISNAGVLSEDNRYETFEGDNITINNILEEEKVDVEIEGNTLVNLLSKEDMTNMLQIVGTGGINGTDLEQYDNGFKITTTLSDDGTYKFKFKFRLDSLLNGRVFTLFYDSPNEKIQTCIYNETTSDIEYIYK